jgi:hypothetical protein
VTFYCQLALIVFPVFSKQLLQLLKLVTTAVVVVNSTLAPISSLLG